LKLKLEEILAILSVSFPLPPVLALSKGLKLERMREQLKNSIYYLLG